MSLKASFFNKSIFKTDMKRFWWLGLLETLVLIVAVVIPLYERCAHYEYREYYYAAMIAPNWNAGGLLLILFGISVTTVLLSYMHFSSSVSGHHSIPVTRKTLLCSKLISTAFLTFVPIIINGIIMLALLNNNGFHEFYTNADILKWIITGILYTSVIVSLTALVNMMTGNPIGTLVFTVGFMALPGVLILAFSALLELEVFGYVIRQIDGILSYIYIVEKVLLTFPFVIIYPLLTVLFILGAYKLYGKRKLESHGEVITFKWLVPVFIGVIAIFASIISYIYFVGILRKEGIIFILPIGCVGTVIAWMISRKSLSLKGVFKPLGIYLLAGLVFCAVFYYDLTGYERRIPDIDDVECVLLMSHQDSYIMADGVEVRYKEEGKKDLYFRDTEDINNVRALHKYLVDNRREMVENGYDLPVEYTLKNGRKLRRRYYVNLERDAKYLKPVFETEQMKASLYKLADGTEKEYVHLSIQDRRVDNNYTIYPDNQYLQLLTEAITKDIEELEYENLMLHDGASTTILVEFKTKKIYEKPVEVENYATTEFCVIYPAYKNTMAVLEKMGYHIPTAEEIEGATIETWDGEVYYKDIKDKKITNTISPEEIAAAYKEYDGMIEGKKYTNYETCKNIKISYRLKTGKTFEVSCSYDEDKIPEVLKKYF